MKYWFSVNDEEQERRFADRMRNPIKRWKLSPMDLEARKHWVEYSRAKEVMLHHTDRPRTRPSPHARAVTSCAARCASSMAAWAYAAQAASEPAMLIRPTGRRAARMYPSPSVGSDNLSGS